MDERFDHSSWLALARRRAWIVLLAVAAGIGGAAGVTATMQPTYEATATMFVGSASSSGEPAADIAYASLAQSLVASYQQLAETRAVALEAATRSGLEPDRVVGNVTAEAEPGVQVLRLRARAPSARLAAGVANAVAAALAARVERLSGATDDRVGLELVDPALPPGAAAAPRLPVNLSFGAVVGLLIGLAVSFALESLHPRIRTTTDIERELGLATLGSIPHLGRRERMGDAWGRHALRGLGEPYRSLAVSLTTIAERDGHRRILITSCRNEEGKTTVTAQVGLALAEQGRKTALIEGDLHRPALWRWFPFIAGASIGSASGRSNYPLRSAKVSSNLNIISGDGGQEGNTARAPEFALAIDAALEGYDHVLIDAPPALAVSDTRVLARHADAVLFVVRAGVTSADDARAALVSLRQLDVKIAGAVLVAVRGRRAGAYYYDAAPPRLSALGRRRESSA